MPGPGAQLGTLFQPSDGPGAVDSGGGDRGGDSGNLRNPLLCSLCEDYYNEPCLLQCYHTFCSKCVRGRDSEGRMACPLCGNITLLKDNSHLPPLDTLMKQLMELVNAENPPCANCDKRDKNSMFFCSTCGQALCNQCRENTHRAKMFSSHEVVHTSKCAREGQKRCSTHGEQYIMFNTTQKTMLCVTCFRDTPPEARRHCVDIDTAYQQSCNKLDSAVVSVCEAQNSVREGLLMFKTLLEELRHNMDLEKHTINTFCQGMQEAIAKTHSSMMMEIQRQYESKERSFRGQLVTLGTMLPVIQLHLLLCQSFTNIANKYQFLDLAYPMIERLSAISQLTHPQRPVQSSQIRTNYRNEFAQSLEPWVGKVSHLIPTQDVPFEHPNALPQQPQQQQQIHSTALPLPTHQPSKRQHTALRSKAMEGEGPFSNHCRSFDTQVKELSQQLSLVKERLGDLHRDVALLRRAQTPPLISRYQHIAGDCSLLEEQLERHQVELERMKKVFDTLWEEQLCRIHVEQDIFQSQMNEILTLRAEVKHLSTVAQQLEPYIKSLTASLSGQQQQQQQQQQQHKSAEQQKTDNQQVQELSLHNQQLQSLLAQINLLQLDTQNIISPTAQDNILFMKEAGKESREGRPRPRTPCQSPGTGVTAMLDAGGHVILYDAGQRTQQSTPSDGSRDKRGVISQLIEKVRTKEDRKKSPEDRERSERATPRERSKSDGRAELIRAKAALEEMQAVQKQTVGTPKGKAKKDSRHSSDGKVPTIYHSISGRILSSRGEPGADLGQQGRLPPPPPPPARRSTHHDPNADIRERLENHLKEKLHDILSRNISNAKHGAIRGEKSLSLDAQTMEDYQRISEAILASPEDRQCTRALVHREPRDQREPRRAGSSGTSPHRRDRSRERPRSRERRERSRERRDASKEGRDRSRETRERSREGKDRSRESRERRDKHGRCYPASDTEDNVFCPADINRKQNSCDSLTMSTVSVDSRKSSTDLGDRKTLVLVIGSSKGSGKQRSNSIQKQRSWETFPPKKKALPSGTSDWDEYGRNYRDSFEVRPSSAQDGRRSLERPRREREPVEGTLRKADSFEGHEEAVRTLVEAVQKTRSQQQQQPPRKSGGHVSN